MTRRLLFIGINYYDYSERICQAFREIGYDVEFREIEPIDFFSKVRKKICPAQYRASLDRYHESIIESLYHDYDIVLFIQTHHFSIKNMEALKKRYPSSRFVLYNWDSVATHDFRPWLKYFDKICTFDREDAELLNISYLPLFAVDEYFKVSRKAPLYGIYFVGAIGTFYRFDALKKLWLYCKKNRISCFFHLKCSPAMFLKLLATGRWLPGMRLGSLDQSEIIKIMEMSSSVFDFANHKQSGFTMRTIENMCAGVKVITENFRIEDEKFFRKDRFLVVRDLNFSQIENFLRIPVASTLHTSHFDLKSWASRLLS